MLKVNVLKDLGQQGRGSGIALSHKANQIAVACGNDIKLWRLRDRMFLRTLEGNGYVKDLKYSPDGNKLISSHYWTTLVWDITNFERVLSIDNGNAYLSCDPVKNHVALSGDFKARDYDIYLWDLDSGVCISRILTGYESMTTCLSFSPNGDLISSSERSGNMKAWNVNTGELIYQDKHEYSVSHISFSQGSDKLAVGYENGTIEICNLFKDEPKTRFSLHEDSIVNISWLPTDDQYMVSASSDGAILVWNIEDIELVQRLKVKGRISRLIWEQQYLATAGRSVRLFSSAPNANLSHSISQSEQKEVQRERID